MTFNFKTICKVSALFFALIFMSANECVAQTEEQTPSISEIKVSASPEKGLVSNHVYEGVQVTFEALSQGVGQWEFEWTEDGTIIPAQKQSKFTQVMKELGAAAYPVEREYNVSARCIIDKTVESEKLDTIVKDSIIKDTITVEKDSVIKDSVIVEKDSVIKDSVIVDKDSVIKDSVITETDTIVKDSIITVTDTIVKDSVITITDIIVKDSIITVLDTIINDLIVTDTIINPIIITTVVKDTIDNITCPSIVLSIWPKPNFGEDKILEKQIVQNSKVLAGCGFELSAPDLSGGNTGKGAWKYQWLHDGKDVSDKKSYYYEHTGSRRAAFKDSIAKGIITQNYVLKVENIAPDNATPWIMKSYTHSVHIYNSPIPPTGLKRKGNGTTRIMIVETPLTDEQINNYGYQFVYGYTDAAGNNHIAGTTNLRYFQYPTAQWNQSDYWVQTVWTYEDGTKVASPHYSYKDKALASLYYLNDIAEEEQVIIPDDPIIEPTTVEDITNLIDNYLEEGSLVTIEDITKLIDDYLNSNNE